MAVTDENWNILIELMKGIYSELQLLNGFMSQGSHAATASPQLVLLPFKGSEIYLLLKAFIDAGGAPNENYRSLLKKMAPFLASKTQKGFSAESMSKYNDKVNPEAKDNVKRFLQRMIRNVESYD